MDELEYRRMLKALPAAIEPERDLWTGIAARIETRQQLSPRRARALFPFAAAAGFAAVAIVAGWFGLHRLPDATQSSVATSTPVIVREAQALRVEFDAALMAGGGDRLAALREQTDPQLVAAWTELDAATSELDAALSADPESRFLLNRMKQVQSKRLHLTQKALSA